MVKRERTRLSDKYKETFSGGSGTDRLAGQAALFPSPSAGAEYTAWALIGLGSWSGVEWGRRMSIGRIMSFPLV